VLRWPLQARLRDKHIKWAERRKLLKDAIQRTRRTTATCSGVDDQERAGMIHLCTLTDCALIWRCC
jgi:hypothetical protein